MICSTATTIVIIPTLTNITPIKILFHVSKIPTPIHLTQIPILLAVKTPLILTVQRKSSSNMAMEQQSSPSFSSSSLILTSSASGRINALFSVQALKSFLILINAFVLLLLLPFRGRRRTVPLSSSSSAEKPKDFECGAQRKPSTMVRVPAIIVPWKSSASPSSSSPSPRSSGGGCGCGAVVVDQEVAARRALAIRRVLQDDDPNSVREFSLFVTARGDTIFTQSWTPVSGQIRGLVILMHGLNEHSGRYNDFAKQLNAHGFKVYGMDWIGLLYLATNVSSVTGISPEIQNLLYSYYRIVKPERAVHWCQKVTYEASLNNDGLHGYVHSINYAVDDLKSFLDKVMGGNPGLPCFCFGHSTGAAIVLKTVLDPKVEARVAGVVLTSPAVGVQPSHRIFVLLAPVFSVLLPRLQVGAANKKGMPVSRDPEALVAKYSDPLVYIGSIRVRTGYEILRISTYLKQNLSRLKVPFLVLHGTADTVTDPEASQNLYEEASTTDKTIRLFEGFLHDLLFEPERDDIVNDIIEWLSCRI